ncbi:MAG TPA: PQQ-binding-like beta-propeller repeat protein [Bryobacteraceae bacterium]|nr:PQQ-binding-like beta-propeller repeat protein [Bryobacteraceae bacterium]
MQRILTLLVCSAGLAAAQEGQALFQKNCAMCHKPGGENRTPTPDVLAQLPPQAIVAALETGSMKAQGAALSAPERLAIARFLSKSTTAEPVSTDANTCPSKPPLTSLAGWNGWGVDQSNSRFQPAAAARLTADQVPNLKVKWAFGFKGGGGVVYGQPTIAGGRLFFGSADGTIYSMDARTGCTYWTFKVPSAVRTAITLTTMPNKRYVAFFGDIKANVYALDAQTGEQVWQIKVDDHPVARITGAPKLYKGRLYVPVSSIEEASAGSASYACCKFRGSVVALDASTGKQLWKTYSIPDAPSSTGKNSAGADRFGPAGAAIWDSPTIDEKRKLLYVGTGNQYSDPPSKYSDAVLALDLDTGSMKWAKQLTGGDGWNFSCISPNKASCPTSLGEDTDIGSSPILRSVGHGHDLLIVGQKSGVVWGLDPDKQGEVAWSTRIGKGGALGGIMWGSAASDDTVYVPLSDFGGSKIGESGLSGGGMFAIKIANGEKVWYTPPAKPACAGKIGCTPSQMAPATLIPGVVFSGSMDGHLRAYSTKDGSVVWDFDTLPEFATVNGVKAHGGSLSATGPTIADGMLFVNSGYGALGGMAGNIMFAFSVEGK